jgi:hypothetical protein
VSEWKSSEIEPCPGQWIIVKTANGFFIGQYQSNPFKRVMNWELSKWYQGFTHWTAFDIPGDLE